MGKYKVSAWLAVNANGDEYIFNGCPKLTEYDDWTDTFDFIDDDGSINSISGGVRVPNGTIKKLLGKDITFDESPIEIL